MPEDNSKLKDAISITKEDVGNMDDVIQPAKRRYEVVAESGLFKNGKQVNKGEFIELDEKTAKNFIANNDIKEA